MLLVQMKALNGVSDAASGWLQVWEGDLDDPDFTLLKRIKKWVNPCSSASCPLLVLTPSLCCLPAPPKTGLYWPLQCARRMNTCGWAACACCCAPPCSTCHPWLLHLACMLGCMAPERPMQHLCSTPLGTQVVHGPGTLFAKAASPSSSATAGWWAPRAFLNRCLRPTACAPTKFPAPRAS